MLTQQAARTFFVVGTLIFGGAFLGLTIDTLKKVPEITHANGITPEVIAGKHLFEEKNCMGCHTILGEGAYYAPELTKVMERRGPGFVKAMLEDPEKMYPGERRMTNFHFKPEEIQNLMAFMTWVGKIDTLGFPPKPHLGAGSHPVAPAAGASVVAVPATFSTTCVACHSMNGQGGKVGPALDGEGSRRDKAWLEAWLRDPAKVKPGTTMPNLQLSEADIATLADFLAAQK